MNIAKYKAIILIIIYLIAAELSLNKLGGFNNDVFAENPGWINSCNYSHSVSENPIVFPGKTGHSYLNDFFGSVSANAYTDSVNIHTGDTSCLMKNDKSVYWVPALYKNNVRVLPVGTNKNILIYYQRAGIRSETVISSIPDGLKMVIGNSHANSLMENGSIISGRIIFKCGPGSGENLIYPPVQCASGIMTVSYTFPNCWDGVNLDSTDHKSHMAYPIEGNCPATHPVAIPRIQAYIRYPVGTGAIGNLTLSSGPFYTANMGFFNGWDSEVLDILVGKCINSGQDCGKNPVL
ncbi:hypothetical protein A3F07_01610 [candidate division WWE3 bacterium RIFCSPHIGHO2_12_FULL_38_15]|uniref:DUF1996 domain-containing protein n=1 Tax=candidate division WWE3 bacterium RIFCSPHIGHO2_02_FULL_38_14 TaxID=1802620 RepID=A0A1F4VAE9_UNCKA|nr:MAG: hypothetical protein A2793_01690 [candidate division WWE3 bacterium RIFCSPHIGHO2_01_FULL_38_45]OGC48402.1 MAG: hypothetical protein A3F07_01610 [candidate division WWE3 bacterium RIFCSPHIGHO2_12_FULL_38_15]OGC53623.1 MAG: hypothetical protein A3D91_04245 [candidate division WWE3 bacterium RIFCSPHIGHO2_02_FULL_38_14]OGC54335.1 MAG: hypothetical protein A3B64_02405 [candidate division WWE3 bacterium RIFCSPLOWO2_01_FULL_37_24]HLB51580.1 DUF1996 domain-containing protein [Patescibacteria gr